MKRSGRGRRANSPRAQQATERFSALGRQRCPRWNAERWAGPRCGAKRRSDGEPCENLPLENGRCRLHGGKTPKGDEWHKPQWPDPSSPDAMGKMHRKLEARERAARRRAARREAMTPEEREAHDAWHRTRKPGSAAARARAGAEYRQNREARRLIEAAEAREAAEAEARVEAQRIEAERLAAPRRAPPPATWEGDIFA